MYSSNFRIYTLVYDCLQLKLSLQRITCQLVEFLAPYGIFHWYHQNLFHSRMLYSFKMVLILAFSPCIPWLVSCRFSGHFFSHFPSFPFLIYFILPALIFQQNHIFLRLHFISFGYFVSVIYFCGSREKLGKWREVFIMGAVLHQ